MPKNNPYLIKENFKQVEEVREIEVKNEVPSFEEFMKTYEEDEKVIDSYYYEVDSYGDIRVVRPYGPGWGEWVAKTAIVVGGGFVLGPIPAMVVGGVTAGGAKIAENYCDNESDKKVFRFIGDCGGGIATGGAVGAAFQSAGALIGGSETIGVGSNIASSAARRAAGEYFVVDGMKIFANAERARKIAAAMHGAKVAGDIETLISLLRDAGYAYSEAKEHAEHINNGYSYKSWCKVCNA